ncbi:MAG TPA: heavy metal translocating P-type ATPase [Thiotrichaceae bacterium]|nr:heavy metal translocating P-type ATPase [Thiotrichaceae bacterium]
MLLISTLVVSGVMYGGFKMLSKKPKKETTGFKKKQYILVASRRKNRPSSVSNASASLETFKEQKITPFISHSRDQQRREISSLSDETEMSEAEKKTHEDFIAASTALGLATGGTLLYSPLSLLSVPFTIWVCIAIFRDAYQSLFKKNRVGMSVLDTIFMTGTIGTGHYFAASVGVWAYAMSRKLLLKTEDQSKQSLINVFGEQASFVWLLSDGIEIAVPFESLLIGDIVIVYAGETIPVDGTISSGTASIDQHILTGESQPVEKEPGDDVFASTVLLSGKIEISVQKTGEQSVAVQIGKILSKTADFKNDLQSWGEEIAEKSVLPTLTLGALTLPILGATSAITILNSCFGFKMRILSPLSMLTFLNLTSQRGILIKDGRSLQLLTNIDTIVFDKTGTLTLEQPHVGSIYTYSGISENELLTYAAAAEYKQTHPIAKAILQTANKRGLNIPEIEEAKYEVGYGIKVTLSRSATHSEVISVGSARFIEMENITIPAKIKAIHQSGHEKGYSFVYVAINNQLYGAIELRASIRPEAKQIISELQQRNMLVYIISGDNEQPTRKLAQELGIEHYFAETLPEKKADLIEKLQKEGKSVCFIGDGINDCIALKKANVSISLRGASSIATDTAQIVLMDQSLKQLVQVFDIAQNFEGNMKVNLMATILPGLMTIGGVYFLHFGIIHSIILNNIGVAAGASNAMLPLIKHQQTKPLLHSEGLNLSEKLEITADSTVNEVKINEVKIS